MAIEFDCVCGEELHALTGQAGRRLTCPRCRSDLVVPPRSTPRRREAMPELGVDTAPPVRLTDRPRRRPSLAWEVAWAVVRKAVVLVALTVGLLGAWGLFFAPGRSPGGP